MDTGDLQNLTRTSLSKNTSLIKFPVTSDSFFQKM